MKKSRVNPFEDFPKGKTATTKGNQVTDAKIQKSGVNDKVETINIEPEFLKKTFSDLNKSIRKGETRDVEIKHITKERLPFEGYDERYKIDMKYIANIEKQLKNSRAAILNKLSIISSKFSFEFSESFTIVFIKKTTARKQQ